MSVFCVALVACGDPSGVPREFEFEPEAVITLENGTAVLARTEEAGSCGSRMPDRIEALVSNKQLPTVQAWIDDVGFEVLEAIPSRDETIIHVRVPLGASPAAVDAIAKLEGVTAAGIVGIAEGPRPCTTQ